MDLDAIETCYLAAAIAIGTIFGNVTMRRRLVLGRGLSARQRLAGGIFLALDSVVQSCFLLVAILAVPRLTSIAEWALATALLCLLAIGKVCLIDNPLERWRDRRLASGSSPLG
jgi:hypothetical protein